MQQTYQNQNKMIQHSAKMSLNILEINDESETTERFFVVGRVNKQF